MNPPNPPIVRLVRRHPLPAFFALAYALSWWGWPLYGAGLSPVPIASFGPFLAALVVLSVTHGRAGVGALLRRMARWRVGLRWYAVALLLPVAVAGGAAGLNVLLGAQPQGAVAPADWSRLASTFLLVLLIPGFGGAWEEPGWRGYGQPALQARRPALGASLLLGLLVAGWHLPLFATGDGSWSELGSIVGATVVIAWVFNSTGGSVLLTMLLHAANNTASGAHFGRLFAGADARHPRLAAERAVGPGGPGRGALVRPGPPLPPAAGAPNRPCRRRHTAIRREPGNRRGPRARSSRRAHRRGLRSIPIRPVPGGQPVMLRLPAPRSPRSPLVSRTPGAARAARAARSPRSPRSPLVSRTPGAARAARAARSPRRPFLAAATAAVATLARAPGHALAAGARGPAAQGPSGAGGRLTEGALAGVEAYVAGALERFGVPGAAVAVVQGGALRFARGFGVTELGGGGRPVGPATRFIIGSLPKSMTALLVGTLVDEGRLGWDTPVVEALPQFALADPAATAAVTFRDLLSMRSGLPRFDGPLFFRPLSPEQVVESLAGVPLSAPPGEVFGYTNQGYATAGFAAAAAAGARYGHDLYPTYARLMQERLFDPAGMARTTLDFDAGAADPDRAAPHAVDLLLGRRIAFPLGLERGGFSVVPAGGTTWASVEDLARYLLLQLGRGVTPDGRRVVSEAALLETHMPHTPTPDGSHFGLGWMVGQYRGLEHLDYTGGNLGYTSYVALLPAADLGVVVLTNTALAAPFKQAVADYVLEAALGLEHAADAGHQAAEREIGALLNQLGAGLRPRPEPGEVAGLLGRYGDGPGVEARLDATGALVLTTAFGDFPLYPVAGQAGAFLVGLGPGVTATFAPGDGSGGAGASGAGSLTVGWLLGDPQPPLILTRTA